MSRNKEPPRYKNLGFCPGGAKRPDVREGREAA
jgi:hypothetical protein